MRRRDKARPKSYTPSRGQFAGRRFRSKWEYRKALAAARSRAGRPIRSQADLERLSQTEREKRADALEVLNLMRRGRLSLRKAVRYVRSEDPSSRLTERAVHKYVGTALYKQKRTRRWMPKKSDRLLRLMKFPTRKGVAVLEIKDSRIASWIGAYWNAVKGYLNTGDRSGLRPFRGKTIKVGKTTYRFVTSPKTLERLAEFGETEGDSIYERSWRSRK